MPDPVDPYSFPLTREQLDLRDRARLAAAEIALPGAAARDVERRFPESEIARLSAAGWLGMTAGEEQGGTAIDTVSTAIVVTEFSRACASIGLLIAFHTLVVETLRRSADPEARKRYLPALATGDTLGALALADPVADSGRAPADAEAGDGGYTLRNWKAFVPGAVGAGLFLVYAYAGRDAGRPPHPRIFLLVPAGEARLAVGEADALIGVRGSGTASIRFDSLQIPRSHVVGPAEEVRSQLREILALADILVTAQAVGIAEAAHEQAVAFALSRDSGGSISGARQRIQFPIADMRVGLDASRLLLLRACLARDAGGDFIYEAAQARGFASRAAVRIADSAIQIAGGAGSLADHGIERLFRDAKTTELNPSTRETAMLTASRHLLEE